MQTALSACHYIDGSAGYGKIFSQGLSGGKSEGADAKSDVSHSA